MAGATGSGPRGGGAGVVAALATYVLRRSAARVPGGSDRWDRTNHRGESVSMLEGPAVAGGLVVGALAARSGRVGLAGALAVAGAGAFGVIDDLGEDTATRTKGLRGHLGALARGELTTGGLKVVGIGASAVAAALVAGRAAHRDRTAGGMVVDALIDAGIIAGTANLINLLDLRPGRALKAATVTSSLLVPLAPPTRTLGCVLVGGALVAAPADLSERDMLGDGGANALGALLGAQAAFGLSRAARCAVLAGVAGLTLTSERVSFSSVIERTPPLRAVDRWGRRP